VQIWELLQRFGHGDLPPSHLAGLLSECGYTGDQLKAILDKAAEKRKHRKGLKNHKSIIVRTAAEAVGKHKVLRRLVPESTKNICCASALACICCTGFIASMGAPPQAPRSRRSRRLLSRLPSSFKFLPFRRPQPNRPRLAAPCRPFVSLSLL
jgi:hypothetical protein